MTGMSRAGFVLLGVLLFVSGCGMRSARHSDDPESNGAGAAPSAALSGDSITPVPSAPKDRMTQLTEALSQATARIEELDAKLSALSDKVEAQKIAVDNVLGAKPLKTQTVGAAKKDAQSDEDAEQQAARSGHQASRSADSAVISSFRAAMDLLKSGKYSDAVLAFGQITDKYPDHILAGSAQFQAGESYFMMGEYKLALNEYGKVIRAYADSPRVACALVRLSQCYGALGNATEAARTAELARDMYFGNPALDWPAPSAAAARGTKVAAQSTQSVQDNALKAEPMDEEHKAEETH